MKEAVLRPQFPESKIEKHRLTIDGPDEVRSGGVFKVRIGVDGADEFPSTAKHHFRWIALHFFPDETDGQLNLGHYSFSPPEAPPGVECNHEACTVPAIVVSAMVWRPGTLRALAECSLHGMCEGTKRIRLL